jgi:outer membrane protein insertion porin family
MSKGLGIFQIMNRVIVLNTEMRVCTKSQRRSAIRTRFRNLAALMVLAGLLIPLTAVFAEAARPIKVTVLPFAIKADRDLDYLSTQIADVLADRFRRNGAVIVQLPPEQARDLMAKDLERLDTGQIQPPLEAERIVWGSLTQTGDRFSLDARMKETAGKARSKIFHAEGAGLENLLKVLNGLAEQIGLKLFHRQTVAEVRIAGNRRIEADAITRVIKTQAGDIYRKDQISRDIKSIFEMGYFDDLRVDSASGPNGVIVTFHVKEKPTIRRIKFSGNLRFNDEDLKENLTITTGSILNIYKVRNNIDHIESMYKEKNYHQAKVTYKLTPLTNNQADIEFAIEEGPKLYVTRIRFEGNRSFDDKKLKKQIQTSEKGFFYWLTSSGDLDRTKLDQDAALLNNYYLNQGYINSRVADPQVELGEEGIQITFKIEEGSRYKVGHIDVAGDLILPKAELLKDLKLGQSVYFNREILRNDVIALTDLYGNHGYAYADVKPLVKENADQLIVNITYEIDKKQEVFYEKILIDGNTRTRDKVIRRELKVHEQERFDGAALKKSIRRLYRLNYFEDIKVDSLKGSADDKMVLKLNVTEKPTGQFQFGAGYSSEENVFFVGSIVESNFLGRGQTLKVEGTVGGSTRRYNVGFTEPWLFDIPLSATVGAYDQVKDYIDYDRDSNGGSLGFSYPIFEYSRIYWSYAYDSSNVTEIADDADETIKELEGTLVTSSTSLSLGYDSRDSLYTPTEGSKHIITLEYAGLGGDVGFRKLLAETGWYFPLFKGLVGFVHGRVGTVTSNGGDWVLPDYEKFYLGGINSLRGFDYRGVHITNTRVETDAGADGVLGTSDDVTTTVDSTIGGTKMAQFNFEVIIPIVKKMGVMGVVFFDAGNVYEDSIDLGDLRRSAGYGFRWFSPLAPIRIEYGRVLDKREGESSGRWEFTMGSAF